jgi:hypothetical protein
MTAWPRRFCRCSPRCFCTLHSYTSRATCSSLWIFGDNVEDYLGHFTYLVFYLLSGLAAGHPHSAEPGVAHTECGCERRDCGGHGSVLHFVSAGARADLVSADIFLSCSGVADAGLLVCGKFPERHGDGDRRNQPDLRAEIAFWAHVGGFVAGVVMINIFRERPQRYRYGTW